MKKLLRYFLKSITWTLASWITTFIVISINTNDPTFTFAFALLLSFVITCVSTACVPVYMLHEWFWDKGDKK